MWAAGRSEAGRCKVSTLQIEFKIERSKCFPLLTDRHGMLRKQKVLNRKNKSAGVSWMEDGSSFLYLLTVKKWKMLRTDAQLRGWVSHLPSKVASAASSIDFV